MFIFQRPLFPVVSALGMVLLLVGVTLMTGG